MNAILNYKGATTHYEIRKDDSGIFHASLVMFNGSKEQMPPKSITLIRSIRAWTGSCDDFHLVTELGAVIEKQLLSEMSTGRGRKTL